MEATAAGERGAGPYSPLLTGKIVQIVIIIIMIIINLLVVPPHTYFMFMPDTILRTLRIPKHFILMTSFRGHYYYYLLL